LEKKSDTMVVRRVLRPNRPSGARRGGQNDFYVPG